MLRAGHPDCIPAISRATRDDVDLVEWDQIQ
jgi:hypothetical protein